MTFLDSIFEPILQYNAGIVIIVISLVLSVLITLIYKWMTDQTLMKSLKDDIKKSQDEMKKHRDNPKKMMEVQKSAMEKNMQYMVKSMKPTLVTFIPLILVFGWLNTHYTYDPIHPGELFTMTVTFAKGSAGEAKIIQTDGVEVVNGETQQIKDDKATWQLRGKTGTYLVQVDYGGSKYDKEVTISENYNYATPVKLFKEEKILSLNIDVQKLRVFGDNFSVFGWHPGWLGVYLICSVIFSMVLRKAMKIY